MNYFSGTCIYTYAPNSMCVSDNEQGCGKGSRQVLGTLQSGGEDCPQEHVLVEECHLPPCGNCYNYFLV